MKNLRDNGLAVLPRRMPGIIKSGKNSLSSRWFPYPESPSGQRYHFQN